MNKRHYELHGRRLNLKEDHEKYWLPAPGKTTRQK